MKPLTKNLLLLAGTLLILFLVSELVLRLFLAPPTYPVKELQESTNPLIAYELQPNLNVTDYGGFWRLDPVQVQTNSHGNRDKEYPYSKPSDVFRIAVLGDSITFAQYVNAEEGYTDQLEVMLGQKFEVLNFGVPGYNTIQEAEILKEKALRYDPDLLIVFFVANDFEPTFNPISADTFVQRLRQFLRHIYTFRFGYWYYYKAKTSFSSESLAQDILDTSSPKWIAVREAFEKINTHANSIPVILVSMPVYYETDFYTAYSAQLATISDELSWHYLNLGNLFTDYEEKSLIVLKEGHPNRFAHSLIAEALFSYLTEESLIP